ncbi:hypothetical protein LAWI1_G007217 [Lachnellula willkommii]|uniref:C2H2-type domain-containing protein n=1 Tax=Lachnellula willkommii TaxID=215461 RepID=A0A559MF39_9HELO|nr:hypothetical protein LAWI1_G007217 [Lachnellula willkommii]
MIGPLRWISHQPSVSQWVPMLIRDSIALRLDTYGLPTYAPGTPPLLLYPPYQVSGYPNEFPSNETAGLDCPSIVGDVPSLNVSNFRGNGTFNSLVYGGFEVPGMASLVMATSSWDLQTKLDNSFDPFVLDNPMYPNALDQEMVYPSMPFVTVQDMHVYNPTSMNINPLDLDFTTPIAPGTVAQPSSQPSNTQPVVQCTQPGCPATFRRHYERSRHEATAHGVKQGVHLCPVAGCSKSQGAGYSRADKVKEHLWKKHAGLGYTKSR